MTSKVTKAFGPRLKWWREHRGLSQLALSGAAEISQRHLSFLESGRAECTALHKGRTTMVWQTRITRGDGRLAALVTQTQMVLKRG